MSAHIHTLGSGRWQTLTLIILSLQSSQQQQSVLLFHWNESRHHHCCRLCVGRAHVCSTAEATRCKSFVGAGLWKWGLFWGQGGILGERSRLCFLGGSGVKNELKLMERPCKWTVCVIIAGVHLCWENRRGRNYNGNERKAWEWLRWENEKMEKGKNEEGGGQQEQIKAVLSYQPHFLGAHQMHFFVSLF